MWVHLDLKMALCYLSVRQQLRTIISPKDSHEMSAYTITDPHRADSWQHRLWVCILYWSVVNMNISVVIIRSYYFSRLHGISFCVVRHISIAFLQWNRRLFWIRREMCTDQASFTSKNSPKQLTNVGGCWSKGQGDGLFHWRKCYYGLWTHILARSNSLKLNVMDLFLRNMQFLASRDV